MNTLRHSRGKGPEIDLQWSPMYYPATMRRILSTFVTVLLLLGAVQAGAAIDTSEPVKVAWSQGGA